MSFQSIFQLVFSFPFTVMYGIGVAIRNQLYKYDVLRSVQYDIPIITIGNLSTGGTGKTPHVEYLLHTLRPHLNIATLSRGYKRNSKGFISVSADMDAKMVGDEPIQFKRKFRDVYVTVAESRTFAVSQIMMNAPGTQLVLLDDGFQHRALQSHRNILLTTFDEPFTSDYLLPGGNLREWRRGYRRASTIVVTKCPLTITEEIRDEYLEAIKPLPHQNVYFSYYDYGIPYYFFNPEQGVELTEDLDVILMCGLASSDYLVKYLDDTVNFARILEFPDHYYYKQKDMDNLHKQFEQLKSKQKIILTTEKDAVRLELHRDFIIKHQLPIFILPLEVAFHFGEKKKFDNEIKQFLLDFKV